jgi:hypothetical protein
MRTRLGSIGRSTALALTAAVVFGAGGCGDQEARGPGYARADNVVKTDGAKPLSFDQLWAASTKATRQARTARLAITVTGQMTMRATGAVSYAPGVQRTEFRMSLPQAGGKKVTERSIGSKIYLQMPGITPPGKFVVLDLADKSSPLAKQFGALAEQADPLAGLKALKPSVKSFERVGHGSIRGVEVDHYQMVVDAQQALKATGLPAPKAMPPTLTYDLWVDAKTLPRRMSFQAAGSTIEIAVSAYGAPVHIERPAAADLVKLPKG